jgi:hypothetical protein
MTPSRMWGEREAHGIWSCDLTIAEIFDIKLFLNSSNDHLGAQKVL